MRPPVRRSPPDGLILIYFNRIIDGYSSAFSHCFDVGGIHMYQMIKQLISGCCLLTFTGFAYAGILEVVDFETGYLDIDPVSSIITSHNTIGVGVGHSSALTSDAYIAKAGGPTTAYVPGDAIPAGHNGGSYFLTDEKNGPSATFNYYFNFAKGIDGFGLDLYDYRNDGGPSIGDSVTLSLFDATNTIIASLSKTILPGTPDPNLFQFDISLGFGLAYSAALEFGAADVGTGVDNLRIHTARVSEPASAFVFGLGVFGLIVARRTRNNKSKVDKQHF